MTQSDTAKPWWLAAVIIAIGAFWFYGSTLLPTTSTYARIGPGMFVAAVGIGLIAFGAMLGVQIARGARFEAQEAEDAIAGQPPSYLALGTVLLGACIPLYTMERFGFMPSAALVFAFTTRAFGSRRPLIDVAIGAAMGGAAWLGFSALGVQLGKLAVWPGFSGLLPGS